MKSHMDSIHDMYSLNQKTREEHIWPMWWLDNALGAYGYFTAKGYTLWIRV